MLEKFDFLRNTFKSKYVGKRIIVKFPRALDKRIGVISLPSETHWFEIVKSEKDPSKFSLVLKWKSNGADLLEVLGDFHSDDDAAAALKTIMWKLNSPLKKVAIGIVLAFISILIIDWFGIGRGASRSSMEPRVALQQQAGGGEPSAARIQQQMERQRELEKEFKQKLAQQNAGAQVKKEAAAPSQTPSEDLGKQENKEATAVQGYFSN